MYRDNEGDEASSSMIEYIIISAILMIVFVITTLYSQFGYN